MKQKTVKITHDQYLTHTMVNWDKALKKIAGGSDETTATAPPVTQNDDSGEEDDNEWDRAARDGYGGRNRSRQRSAASKALNLVQTDVLAPLQAGARAAAETIYT